MQSMQWFDIAWRLLLSGFFALVPGTVFWLAVIGAVMLIRRLGRSRPFQMVRVRLRSI